MIRSISQRSKYHPPFLLEQRLFCPPWFPQAVRQLLQEHLHSCYPQGWGKGCAIILLIRVRVNYNLLSKPSSGSYKLSIDSRIQKKTKKTSYIRFCQCSYYLDGETDPVVFLYCCLSRIIYLCDGF